MASPFTQVGPFQVAARGPKRDSPIKPPSDQNVRRVKAALAAVDEDILVKALIPDGVIVLFGWVDYLPGTKERAAGYATGAQKMLIRHDLPDAENLSFEATVYTILHEGPLGHNSLAQRPPDDEWQRKALTLLNAGVPLPQYSDPDEVWVQAPGDEAIAKQLGTLPYWLRPYECIIDDVVKTCTAGLEAAWSKKYRRRVTDLAALKALWLGPRRSATAPLPPPPPPDTEEPIDPPPPTEPTVVEVTAGSEVVVRAV